MSDALSASEVFYLLGYSLAISVGVGILVVKIIDNSYQKVMAKHQTERLMSVKEKLDNLRKEFKRLRG